MTASFLITFREGLEAAVIVGILLSTLRLLGEKRRGIFIWLGVGAGIFGSILLAWVFENFLGGFEGRYEEVYEGTLMFIAAVIITHMVLWLRRYGKHIKTELEAKVRAVLVRTELWALAALAFTAVLREGVETVIFLKALSLQSDGAISLWGGLFGLCAAIILALLIFLSTLHISPRRFFQSTGMLLVFIAAGLLAHGVVELQEAGVFPNFVNPLFDINSVLSEEHGFGAFLKALFGYDANPSLLAVLAYVSYLTIMLRAMTKKALTSAKKA